ncbi:MAG TPA: FAD-binding oxidoreductase [Candidatus Saccharibacteria bacterium]|nr:FAD-binding oxidoreductase [Candidatus Saccharibacteria bacterium]
MHIYEELSSLFQGELDTSKETLETYSHDASLFELKPAVVARPKDVRDIQSVVSWVLKNKEKHPELSITPRSAGTDMSGGAIGQSIVLDMTAHFNEVTKLSRESARVQPGTYYRDFDKKTIDLGVMLPSYPASRDLCTLGGMVSNNSGGEKSLQYGKTDQFVTELSVVLGDGNEYVVKPLTKDELVRKMAQDDFEGKLYKKTFELLEKHYDEIQAAAPKVSKDSTGYHLWNVWNRETGIFDLTKLFIGAQGTLGIVTDIKVKLVERPEHSGVLVGYLRNIDSLGDIITTVLKHQPATFESFDDNTLWLSFKFFFSFIKKLGFKRWVKLAFQLIPDGLMLVKGVPQLVLMIEFTGHSVDEVEHKIDLMKKELEAFPFSYLEKDETEEKAQKFWIMRRESFSLLRSKVKDKHTAPFIDDFVVPPANLSAFLPKLRVIIKKYKLLATIAGHMGDGNFHVIPLMKIEDPNERNKLQPAMKEVNELVLEYGGSISGEHNDGMVRGPWLERMYGPSVFGHMKAVKELYDPKNIFNPHKKTDADWDFSFSHIRKNF